MYEKFFKLWQNADGDLPILIEAKREYAKIEMTPTQSHMPLLAEEFEIKVTALKILSGWVCGTW